MPRSQIETATVLQVLLEYDGPQIVLLKREGTEYIVAVATPNDSNTNSFLGAAVTRVQLSEYQSERFDLRYLMARPGLRKWYYFRLNNIENAVELSRVPRSATLIQSCLPEAGLFARSHDPIIDVQHIVPNSVEQFDIDGAWDMGEFSSFYGNVEDIYNMYASLERYGSDNATLADKAKLRDHLMRPFRGGGSYLGFYDAIANDNSPIDRLRVSGIQYHSPGYVEVKARERPFGHMIDLLKSFSDEGTEARIAYNTLHGYLSKLGLLRAARDTQINESVAEGIELYARVLCSRLKHLSFEQVKDLAQDNLLVTAKVLLSIYRRGERLFKFFEQGRVSYDGDVVRGGSEKIGD